VATKLSPAFERQRPLLDLGKGFTIDANIAVRRAVLLGQPDAGKTNGLTVIAEGLLKIHVPPAILDWKGDLWGLRSSANGQHEGFAIAIFGGDHGDIQIDESDGRELGRVVADERLPAIVDLSGFPTDASRRRFAVAFLRAFFQAKKTHVAPHPLLIDEYQKFAPESPYADEKELLSVTEQVIGLGRKRGIGVIGTAQRAAALNKNIVELSDVYFFMQIAGKNDLAAIDQTIRRVAAPDDRAKLLAEMPQLHRGEVFVYSPAWLRTFEKARFRLRETYDSSKTPEVGVDASVSAPRIFAMPDIPALRARVAATREKRELDDPEVLRARIVDLESQLRRRGRLADDGAVARLRAQVRKLQERPPIEVPVLTDADRAQLRTVLEALQTGAAEIDRSAVGLAAAFASVRNVVDRAAAVWSQPAANALVRKGSVESMPASAPTPERAAALPPGRRPRPATPRVEPVTGRQSAAERPTGSVELGAAPRAVLEALGSLPERRASRNAVAALAGYSARKSTWRNALSALRVGGLIETPDGIVALTPAGQKFVGPPPAPKTTAETIAMWRSKVRDAAPVALLDVLVAVHPRTLSREELGTRARVDHTKSTMRNALSRLRVQGLIEEESEGVKASDTLFPTGPI